MRTLFAAAALCLLAAAGPGRAAPTVPAAQSQAFALGYTLRACDLRAIAFTHSVKALGALDDQTAGGEITHLSRQAVDLRHTQAVSYTQITRLLTKMGGTEPLRTWAALSAATLSAPLVYTSEEKTLAKTEPDTAQVLAALDEIKATKAAADSHLPEMASWLQVRLGPLAVWTVEVGTYAAGLRAAAASPEQAAPSVRTARSLLKNAPPGAPPAARDSLAEIIPHGGNLGDLATVSPLTLSPDTLTGLFERLLAIYVPRPEKPQAAEKKAQEKAQEKAETGNGVY